MPERVHTPQHTQVVQHHNSRSRDTRKSGRETDSPLWQPRVSTGRTSQLLSVGADRRPATPIVRAPAPRSNVGTTTPPHRAAIAPLRCTVPTHCRPQLPPCRRQPASERSAYRASLCQCPERAEEALNRSLLSRSPSLFSLSRRIDVPHWAPHNQVPQPTDVRHQRPALRVRHVMQI